MSLLKSEPPAPVKTLEELFAIAHAMEHEAAARYAAIAERMRHEGNASLAEVFDHLSAEERGHLASVVQWSQKAKGKAPDPALIRWKIPETFDDEGAATTDPRLLDAYRALAMAVRNEERAFAFWSYVAAQSGAPDVRQAAETMAHEELEHVATLRRERRRAFHVERSSARAEAAHRNAIPETAAWERRLAEILHSYAEQSPPIERKRLQSLAEEARRHAQELEMFPIAVGGLSPFQRASDDPVVLAELLTDRYLEAADLVRDEEIMRRMQALAGRAISRLAWLRTDLPEIEGA
jgi:rubrerythrin